MMQSTTSCPDNYKVFRNQVWKSATASIPRSCKKQYIPCLTEQSKTLYSEYQQAYENDPFAENTIKIGETLLNHISIEKRDRWQELITGIDMTHNSKQAWKTTEKLNSKSNTIYADDLYIATQSKSFEIIENRLTDALEILSDYYKQWFLNANPGKTQVCTFHLNNRQANRNLRVRWENKELKNTKYPVYLGVTLDRTLSFKEHTRKLKEKVASRNNLLRETCKHKMGHRSKHPQNHSSGAVFLHS